MTIAKTGNKSQYTGDGVTTAFAFGYRFFAESDLGVYVLSGTTETKQTLTTHYTVSNTGTESGGTVTFVTAPASGTTVTILGEIPYTQTADYAANDAFPAATHEAALDRSVRLAQRNLEVIGRALVAPASDTASLELPLDRASKFLAFDASKNPIAASATSGVVTSAFMETVLDDETALDARTTLGIPLYGNSLGFPVKVTAGVSKGEVLYAAGAIGASGKISATPFIANGTIDEIYFIGVADSDMATNGEGYALGFAVMTGMSTDGSDYGESWVDGQVLYASASTAGALTKTAPTSPNQAISVAMVLTSHAKNGTLAVRPSIGQHLGELHDVYSSSPAEGDLLRWNNSTLRWENSKTLTTPTINVGSDATGDIYYRNSSGVFTRLALGTAYQTMRVNSGATGIEYGEPPIGVNQTWQDMTASRTYSTSYQNTTGRAIMVSVQMGGSSDSPLQVSTNGSTWVSVAAGASSTAGTSQAIVPKNHYYRLNGTETISTWAELR